jgi:hypothetical protein
MAPFYQGYTGSGIHLKPDDQKGLQHLYGITVYYYANRIKAKHLQENQMSQQSSQLP